jgi:hypothetical protein
VISCFYGHVAGDMPSTIVREQQEMIALLQQSAACNASHRVEARCRAGYCVRYPRGSECLPMTEESPAQMIGARRNALSITDALQQAGVIRFRQERIEITDVQIRDCECYDMVKVQCDRLQRRGISTAISEQLMLTI